MIIKPHISPYYSLCFSFLCSINTLVKISKGAGELLKPHTPKLIPALLESLSVLEPQVLNYLSLRATDQEKVSTIEKKFRFLLVKPFKKKSLTNESVIGG